MNTLRKYILFLLLSSLMACHVNYSFTGASISPDIKTISIKTFTKTSALGPPSLSQALTEKLKDKFVAQTSLSLSDRNADLTLEGSINNYSIAPISIQTNEQAAQNRLTISVTAKFTNLKDEKQNFESTFSRYADYPSSRNLAEVEDNLITEILNQIVDDIFNKAVINW